MDSRQKIAALVAAHKSGTEPPLEACLGGYIIARAPEMNLRANDPLLGSKQEATREGKKGRRGERSNPLTQAALIESYKPQNSKKQDISPEVQVLLAKYGDMRGVFVGWKLFQKPLTPVSEGGWGIGLGAMINAGKTHGLERVVMAVRQAQAYIGANDRGKLFFHILRKGLRLV
jgi:hypothetical protein